MLQSDNWVLPHNNGGEMAYKPPFFHWCIAAVSSITGGNVTEYTSRFPSAVSAILMLMAIFCFFAKRRNIETAFIATLLAFTTFEVHRAIFACRVDMVLTACIVGSLLCLYKWYEKGVVFNFKNIPWLAILLMSCGTLTKGPVAIILPCGVMGLFLLLKRENFWGVSIKLFLVAILSLIIPFAWYYAAYQQGGDDFLMLVKEENIDRFLGKMSYASHENHWTYNVMMLLLGLLPWTLLPIIALFFLRRSNTESKSCEGKVKIMKVKMWIVKKLDALNNMDAYRLFSIISAVLIFVFYCIPKSKRGVYLLPVYPFIAYFIAEFIVWLKNNKQSPIKIYGWFIAVVSFISALTLVALNLGIIPDTIFEGRHAAQNIAFMNALKGFHFILVSVVLLAGSFIWIKFKNIYAILATTLIIFISLDSVIQPAVLNVKSDKQIALEIQNMYPSEKIDSYVGVEMLHFFTINFYNNDKIGVFNPDKATDGLLLIGERDAENYLKNLSDLFNFELVLNTHKKSCDTGQIIHLYRYHKK
jgi:hypothetical protein